MHLVYPFLSWIPWISWVKLTGDCSSWVHAACLCSWLDTNITGRELCDFMRVVCKNGVHYHLNRLLIKIMRNGAAATSDSDCRSSLFCHLLLALSRYQNNAFDTISKTQHQSNWPWASTALTVCGIILYFAPCVGKTSIINVRSYSSGSTSHRENKQLLKSWVPRYCASIGIPCDNTRFSIVILYFVS